MTFSVPDILGASAEEASVRRQRLPVWVPETQKIP